MRPSLGRVIVNGEATAPSGALTRGGVVLMWYFFRVDITAEVLVRQHEIGLLGDFPIKGRAWLVPS